MGRYLEIQQREMSAMEQAIAADDALAVSRLGHKLKGTGTSYGFVRLTELGAAIEIAGKDGKLDEVKMLAAQVRSYLENVDIVFEEMD